MATEMPTITPPPPVPMTAPPAVGAAGATGPEGRGGTAQRAARNGPEGVERTPGAATRDGYDARRLETGRAEEPDDEEVTRAVNEINERSELLRRNLQFSVDRDSGRMIIKVMDAQTKEVIRQIPKEEILEIARSLEQAEGLLFRASA